MNTSVPKSGPTVSEMNNCGESFWESTAQTRWGQYLTVIERRTLLTAHTGFAEPGIALEVGCEGGRWSKLLSERGWTMIATDVDPKALELCRERNRAVTCILVEAAEERLPVESHSVDLLVCIEVPVVASAWFPAEARRVLKPGGVLVGSFNNRVSWRGLMANIKSSFMGRQRFYTKSYVSFRTSMRKQGFSFSEERGCCWMPFGRHSNSALIPMGARLERLIALQRLPGLSPWIIYMAKLGQQLTSTAAIVIYGLFANFMEMAT